MKKGLSFILLFVFLFNLGGYYIVYWGLRYQTDQQLTNRLDANQYDPDETIELKIPVALPYPIQSHDFQRIDGRFEHNGEFFKLIKHKLQDDTLYVVCIRDYETKQLDRTIKDYVRLTQGLPDSNPFQKALHFLGKLLKDFCANEEIRLLHEDGYASLMTFADVAEHLRSPLITVLSPPPRL